MNQLFSRIRSIGRRRPVTLLFAGLEDSGKTSIVSYMKGSDLSRVHPTVGYSIEKFHFSGQDLTIYDVSGQGRYRGIWEYFFKGIDGIVFVVDSTDPPRLSICREELQLLLRDPRLTDLPFLLFSNKLDLADRELDSLVEAEDEDEAAAEEEEPHSRSEGGHVIEYVGLNQIRELLKINGPLVHGHCITAVSCSARDGTGIRDGVKWLTQTVAQMH